MALTVRLNPEGLPNTMDRGRRNLSLTGHGADRPTLSIRRFGLERFAHRFLRGVMPHDRVAAHSPGRT